MVPFVRVLLWTLVRLPFCVYAENIMLIREMQGIIAWPIAKVLEFTLGPHHGIIYRRAGTCLPIFRHFSYSLTAVLQN